MRILGRHLVFLTLSSVLLVNFGLAIDSEPEKQDAVLPALVDGGSDASGSSVKSQPAASPEVAVASPAVPAVTKIDSELGKESEKADEQPQQQDNAAASQPAAGNGAPAEDDAAASNKRNASAKTDESGNSEKDIRTLLANKNDAENDLNSPTNEQDKFSPSGPSLVVVTSTDKKEPAELDAPVEISSGGSAPEKPQVDSNDNRFHYSLAGKSDKPLSATENVDEVTTTRQPAAASVPKDLDEQQPDKRAEREPALAEPTKEAEPSKEIPAESVTGKKAEVDVKSKPSEVELPLTPENKPDSAQADRSPAVEVLNKANPEPQASAPTTTAATTTSTARVPEISDSPPEKKPPSASTPDRSEGEPKEKPLEVEGSSKKATPNATVAEKDKTPNGIAASIPSVLAGAVGSALAGAVNPLSKSQDKEIKPQVASTSAGAAKNTTTKAPSVSTRKSSTDKWDRWSPSTPSTLTPDVPPSTRRRPILPSIRRRFRPYNRFSPFPFGGADSYSPSESDFVYPPVVYPRAPPSTTNKPSRRRTSSTEPPRRTSGGEPADSDEEVALKPQESSTRRRDQGSNRRRHHHHHHHHGPDHGESETGARRYPHNHHRNRHPEREDSGSSGQDSPAVPSYEDGPRRPRPFSSGFGLFNAGPVGSGFDLLNPFSGWLDEAIKPRPPAGVSGAPGLPSTIGNPGRRPGSQPIPVEGDYSDGRLPHEQGHGHEHHHGGRPHIGREDYHDHHHHDCDHHHEHDHEHDHGHDHDHDHHHDHHREPYRPGRPQREPVRPPIGGDYDPYPSSVGRRPSRPYNRRDQTESNAEQGANSEQAAPGLYGAIAPVAPRRVPSIFSPFDSLFGSLDDDLFSLRSSFVDTPAAAKPQESAHAFDTFLSSPKISLPSVEARKQEAADKATNKQPEAALKPLGEQEGVNNDFSRRTRAFG